MKLCPLSASGAPNVLLQLLPDFQLSILSPFIATSVLPLLSRLQDDVHHAGSVLLPPDHRQIIIASAGDLRTRYYHNMDSN